MLVWLERWLGARPPGIRRFADPRPFPHEILALAYIAVGVVLLESLPVTYPRRALFLVYGRYAFLVAVCALVVMAVRHGLRRWRGGGEQVVGFGDEVLALARVGSTVIPLLSVHFLLKSFIYLFNPRVFDGTLTAIDRALCFGIDPGAFLTALLFNDGFLLAMDALYSGLYFPTMVVYVALLLVLLPVHRKLAFAAAYSLLWIAGTALYIGLPSWGPVFVVPDHFEEALQHMPITAWVQSVLFSEVSSLVNNPLAPRVVRFGSVAAFPSLHVAVVGLLTIASRTVSHRWFLFNLVLLSFMIVGSVLTGYHYLVDAWAGLAIAWLAWRGALLLYRPGAGGAAVGGGGE